MQPAARRDRQPTPATATSLGCRLDDQFNEAGHPGTIATSGGEKDGVPDGYLANKRLERGTFAVAGRLGSPTARGSHALSVAEIMAILEGIDIRSAAYHQHYAHTPTRLHASEGACDDSDVKAPVSPI